MEKVKIEPFNVIGIAVKTTNENGQSAKDIGELWSKFMTENVLDRIPNKVGTAIYSIYTDYESDHTKSYTTILACKVKSLDTVPEGMIAKFIKGGSYNRFLTKGDLAKGIVYNEWLKIWNMDLNRIYTSDFEVYGEKEQNPTDAEVEILIATKK